MRIRSVTVFVSNPSSPVEDSLRAPAAVAAAARGRLEQLGYTVQTVRAALPPVGSWAAGQSGDALVRTAQRLDGAANAAGIDYLSLGPLVTKDSDDFAALDAWPAIVACTKSIFSAAFIADAERTILTRAIKPVAAAILKTARAAPNGFGNLRFAALANCPAGIPFFPAAYAPVTRPSRPKANKIAGWKPVPRVARASPPAEISFALATESADLALDACKSAASPADARDKLRRSIESHARVLEPAMDDVARESGAVFSGIDWSLAPHPDPAISIGAALEALSGAPFGAWGTLSAIATLTSALKSANARRVGFCGIFLPVLEDAILARRATEKTFDLQRLLLFSSVCGAGLDTIPLPGGVSEDAIAALLGDVATLACVLNKPLTARLMPVPGLKAGQKTQFDFPYLVNAGALEP